MFQPAEENGGAGALRMIEAGVLEDPTVDAAFAQHVSMARFVGQMGVTPGKPRRRPIASPSPSAAGAGTRPGLTWPSTRWWSRPTCW